MTEKRKYEKPSQRVVELKHRTMLLVGSGGSIPNNDPYTPGADPFDF